MITSMLNIHIQIFMKFSMLKCVVYVSRGINLPKLVQECLPKSSTESKA